MATSCFWPLIAPKAVLGLVLQVEQSLELVPGVGSAGCHLLHEVHGVAVVI